jgi:small subunit ribosomal protein S5
MADAPKPQERRNRRPEIQQEEKQYDERTLHIDRVARVVKGGRRFRFRALVVVGDRKHKVGIGSAKGADVTAAVTKATEVAKKHFIEVSLYKGTLPHETEAKVSGAHILVMPASAGTGLIAGGVVRSVLEVAGVKNAAALDSLVPADKWVTTRSKKTTKKPVAASADKAPEDAEKPKKAVKKPAAKTAKKKA